MKALTIISVCSLCLLAACGNDTNTADLINQKATIPASYNFSQKGLKVIASFINKQQHTMSTLYGNEQAVDVARAGGEKIPGEELTLITWNQQDDVHWFGARIPSELKSIEVVKMGTSTQKQDAISYSCYEGKSLTLNADTSHKQDRIKYILSQQPSVLP